jgi:putative DNA primase/helicase
MIKTGNGRQLYFRHPGGKVRNAAPINKDFLGLDSRADGGYIVAPPSLHRSGRRYMVEDGMTELAEPPSWLVEFINQKPPASPATLKLVVDNDRATIADGSRNSTLTSVAGSMRARGLGEAAIEAALLAHNAEQCKPPLDEDEVRAIARSVSRYAPGSPSDVRRTMNDAGNAERFARQWGDHVRYVPELRQWLVWSDERQWQLDSTSSVMEMAKRTASDIYGEGDQVNDADVRKAVAAHSAGSQQAPRLEAMLKLAQSIPALVAPIASLDTDPWALGVENGTLDLRKGVLRRPLREDYITRVAPVAFDAEAECPTFVQFLEQITDGNQELIEYLQRLMGCMLTGDTREQRLFFLYGTGANGKSTLLNVCKEILGPDLCRQTPSETIMARQNRSGPTPELACLHGSRAVMTTEVDEGSFLSESLVKQMTGGDPVPARHLYGKPFEFIPCFKLLVAGNHKPTIRGSDEGIWRRIDLIPFNVTIPSNRRDPWLPARLRAELPGILNWALAGCRAWQNDGLKRPPAVIEAVAEYREDMDVLGQWVSEMCEVGPDLEIRGGAAYESYRFWAVASGFRPWSSGTFGSRMHERYERRRAAGGVVYVGVALRSSGQPPIAKAKVAPPSTV